MNFIKIFFATLLAIVASMVLLFIVIIGSVTGALLSATTTVSVNPESVLVVDLQDEIVDAPVSNPLSAIDFQRLTIKQNLTTLNVIRAIEHAAVDDNIKGIYLRPTSAVSAQLSIIEEIRAEIERFKESGKFVVAYSDIYSQGGYYLSSVADSVYLQKEGSLVWQGIASTTMFYKDMLDRLDIGVEVFRPTECRYKSAVEPLMRSSMSNESREQTSLLISSLWGGVVSGVAQSRDITPVRLNNIASSLIGYLSNDALSAGLVDALIYEDEMESIFEELGVELNDKGRAERVLLSRYIANQSFVDIVNPSANSVAVLYAEGVIVDGQGEVGEVGSENLARALRKVRADDSIKSVVLRVNSPGGSALAADVMWREVELLRQSKPVVVSMGSYAASGGYYISAPADVVVANRGTVTGSIGVYGVMLDIEQALSSKLGINTDVVGTNPSADFMRSSRAVTAAERDVMTRSVDRVYNAFISHVASGRNLSIFRVGELAQGRVYSGVQAKELGLVDVIGGLKSAILIAAERAGIVDDFRVEEVSLFSDSFTEIFAYLNSAFAPSLGVEYRVWRKIESALKPLESEGGVVMHSPTKIEWR